MIHTYVDAKRTQHYLSDLAVQQLPFAMSKAVNDAAFRAREQVQAENRLSFTIRRPWVLQGWKVKTSTKRDHPIRSLLYLDPTRDFLAKFEEGGVKAGRSGKALTVHIEARQGKLGIVPKLLSVRNLNLRAHRTAGGKIQLKGNRGTFVVRTAANTLILQRKHGETKTLYVFKRTVPIPASLHFYQTARQWVEANWSRIMGRELVNAINTAR